MGIFMKIINADAPGFGRESIDISSFGDDRWLEEVGEFLAEESIKVIHMVVGLYYYRFNSKVNENNHIEYVKKQLREETASKFFFGWKSQAIVFLM